MVNPLALIPPGFTLDDPAPLRLVDAPEPLIPDFELADPSKARPVDPASLIPEGYTLDPPKQLNPIDLIPEGYSLDPPAKTFAKGTMPEVKPKQAGLFDQGELINAMVRSAGPETLKNAGHSMLAVAEWSGDDTWSSSAQELIGYGEGAEKGIKPQAVQSMYDIDSFEKAGQWTAAMAGQGMGSSALPIIGGVTMGAVGTRLGGKKGGLIGTGIGAYFGSEVLSIGEVRQGLIEAGVTDPKLRGKLSVIGGSAMAALDTILPAKIASKMTGVVRKEVQRKLIRHMLNEAKWGVIIEAPTEGAQELVKQLTIAEGTDKFDFEKAFWDVMENTVAGAIGGGTISAVTSPLTRKKGPPGQGPPGGPTEEEILRGMGLPGPEHRPPEQGGRIEPQFVPPGGPPPPGAPVAPPGITPQDAEQAALWQELGIIPETPAIPMPAPAEAPIQPPIGEVAPAPVLPPVELPVVEGWPTQEGQPLQPPVGEVGAVPPQPPPPVYEGEPVPPPETQITPPISGEPLPSPEQTGITFMVTMDMKRRLRELGYSPVDIRNMRPEDATAILTASPEGQPVGGEPEITPPISPYAEPELPVGTEPVPEPLPPAVTPSNVVQQPTTPPMQDVPRAKAFIEGILQTPNAGSPAVIRGGDGSLYKIEQERDGFVVVKMPEQQRAGEPPTPTYFRPPESMRWTADEAAQEALRIRNSSLTGRQFATGQAPQFAPEPGEAPPLPEPGASPEPTLPPLESMPPAGQRPIKQPPIVKFRQEAAEIEARLPPVQEGMTRLWRGNRVGEIGQNPSFTSDLPGIALPFRDAYGGGGLSYVDVPTDQLDQFRGPPGSASTDVEFMLPADIASQAISIAPPGAPAGQRTDLKDININVPTTVSGEGEGLVRLPADQALLLADKRIVALNRLMECLNGP